MEHVTPKELNKPRNVNRFKKGLKNCGCPISYRSLKGGSRCLDAFPTFEVAEAAATLLYKTTLTPACSKEICGGVSQ